MVLVLFFQIHVRKQWEQGAVHSRWAVPSLPCSRARILLLGWGSQTGLLRAVMHSEPWKPPQQDSSAVLNKGKTCL